MTGKIKKMDMHLHSIYSERPSEWILKTIGTRESYINPFELYSFAKERGMDFVTITDHNKIDGILLLKEKKPDDTILGVEVTTYFPEDDAKIHILLYDFEPSIFSKINDLRENIYKLRDFIIENNIFYSVAHPFYSINNKLNIEHIEKLTLLFDNFEAINGGRNIEINDFTYKYFSNLDEEKLNNLYKKYKINPISKNSYLKRFTAGSDDHSGLFIGTAYCSASCENPKEFLQAIQSGVSKFEGKSLNFETHAFQILKIAIDFYKSKSLSKNENRYEIDSEIDSKIDKTNRKSKNIKDISIIELFFKRKQLKNSDILKFFLNSFNKVLFERKRLSLKEKIVYKKIRRNSLKKQDEIKKTLIDLIMKIDNLKTYDPYEISDDIFSSISLIIDSYIGTFVKTLAEKLESNDLAFILGKISSLILPIILSVPYVSSILHLWKDRKLINEVDAKYFGESLNRYKKIAWFTDTLIDLNGVSVTLRNIGSFAAKKDRELYFVTSLNKKEYEENKFEFNVLNFEPICSFTNDIYKNFEVKIPSLLSIVKKLYELNPDEIIISTPGPVGLTGLLISKILSLPSKMIFHTDFAKEAYEIIKDESLSGIIDFLLKTVYNMADEILVNTNEYKEILKEKGYDASKLKIFRRGLDLSLFRKIDDNSIDNTIKEKIAYSKEDFIMLYTGRISKDKNLDFIINIFKDLKKVFHNLKLIVAGDGPYLAELKEKTLKIKDIYFTARVSNKELPYYYSISDIFVFPSVTDTFGMSVLEAQACGLPAIVSNIGGPKELILNNETGYILPIDLTLWKNKIADLIIDKKNYSNKLKQLSINAISNVRRRFDIEKVIDSYFIKKEKDEIKIGFYENVKEDRKYKGKIGNKIYNRINSKVNGKINNKFGNKIDSFDEENKDKSNFVISKIKKKIGTPGFQLQ